jgi:hypothetical protein
MMFRRRRIGPAHAIGLLALLIALGSGAYAATQAPKNSVSTSSVRNSSLTGLDVKNNSLTGNDLKESTLGQVLHTESAHSAQTATSAGSFDGVRKIDYRDNQTNQAQTVLSFRGMDLQATCAPVSSPQGPDTELLLDLHTIPAATVNTRRIDATMPFGADPNERSYEAVPEDLVVRGGALPGNGTMAVIPGIPPALGPAGDALLDSGGPGNFIQGEGQIVYRSNSDVVTVTYHALADQREHTGAGYCEVFGNAVAQ